MLTKCGSFYIEMFLIIYKEVWWNSSFILETVDLTKRVNKPVNYWDNHVKYNFNRQQSIFIYIKSDYDVDSFVRV
jgi:hypothetical protein